MSERATVVRETARGILTRAGWGHDPWALILDGGWIGMGVPEQRGGRGGTLGAAAEVALAAGETAAPIPVIESILVGLMVSACADTEGLLAELIEGRHRAALVPRVVLSDESGCVVDHELRVPWGFDATMIFLITSLVEGGLGLVVLPRADVELLPGRTLAGDPLDLMRLRGNSLPAAVHRLEMPLEELVAAGALLNAARIVGALRCVAAMSVAHSKQRKQLGRPIGAFQTVAHELVRQAAHVSAAETALRTAIQAPANRASGLCDVARVAASLAVSPVSHIAHQVHGPIGFTQEHDLHRYTLRLVTWRDEFASTRWWMRRVCNRAFETASWWDEFAPT
jgi:acyl-CoA dehydrogenase